MSFRFGPQALLSTKRQSIPQHQPDADPILYSVALRNTGATDQTVTYVYIGGEEHPVLVSSGGAVLRHNVPLVGIFVDGGTVLASIAQEPEFEDPHYMGGTLTQNVNITGPIVATSHGNVVAVHDQGA